MCCSVKENKLEEALDKSLIRFRDIMKLIIEDRLKL